MKPKKPLKLRKYYWTYVNKYQRQLLEFPPLFRTRKDVRDWLDRIGLDYEPRKVVIKEA